MIRITRTPSRRVLRLVSSPTSTIPGSAAIRTALRWRSLSGLSQPGRVSIRRPGTHACIVRSRPASSKGVEAPVVGRAGALRVPGAPRVGIGPTEALTGTGVGPAILHGADGGTPVKGKPVADRTTLEDPLQPDSVIEIWPALSE